MWKGATEYISSKFIKNLKAFQFAVYNTNW